MSSSTPITVNPLVPGNVPPGTVVPGFPAQPAPDTSSPAKEMQGMPTTSGQSEKHLLLHLYTTNGETKNEVSILTPTEDILQAISSAPNKITRDVLTKQSLQEVFGEAGNKWVDIKPILNNYANDNKSILAKAAALPGQITSATGQMTSATGQFIKDKTYSAYDSSIGSMGRGIGRGYEWVKNKFTKKTEQPQTAQPPQTGGSRKLKSKRRPVRQLKKRKTRKYRI
jgi:hypothetical protein